MNINQNNIQRQPPTTANRQQPPSFQSVEANFTYVAYQIATSSQLSLKKNLINFINDIKSSITHLVKFCLTIKGLCKNKLIFSSEDLILRSGRFLIKPPKLYNSRSSVPPSSLLQTKISARNSK